MQFLQTFAGLFANFGNLTWQMVVMWVIGRPADLPGHRQKDGAESLAAYGLRRDPCQSAAVRGHHAGDYRRPHQRTF